MTVRGKRVSRGVQVGRLVDNVEMFKWDASKNAENSNIVNECDNRIQYDI